MAARKASPCEEIEFNSGGVRLRAGLFRPAAKALAGSRGLPCIVMAHGLGGTRAAGLEPFAKRFAEAGFTALVFDYRGFGKSDGAPRQVVDVRMQLQDWASAIAHARSMKDVDPQRIALWGSSFSGGVVIAAAVEDGRVAAVSSQGGMLDGRAALLHLLKSEGPVQLAKLSGLAALDAARAKVGLPRVTLPVVGAPGSMAVLTTPDSEPGYLAITPPDWVNRISLSWMLTLPLFRPNILARQLPCPVLFCIAEQDAVVPPAAVEDAARRAGGKATVCRYPRGHFEIYVGEGFEDSVRDQSAFFLKHLSA
ncbi:MAG: alpha/beta hydrolase [Pseudomonadota bacterium]